MLDIQRIREDPKGIARGFESRGAKVDLAPILELDGARRRLVASIDQLRATQNNENDRVPALKGAERTQALARLKTLKDGIAAKESELKRIEGDLALLLLGLPNLPLEGVPVGKGAPANVVLREVGEKPNFSFRAKDYLALAEALDIIDVERAGKVSGSRFGYLKGDAARLEFALIQFAMKSLTDEAVLAEIASNAGLAVPATPFIPVVPPVLIRPEMLGGMGYLKKIRAGWENEEVYFMRDDDLVLVGTSEQSVGPMHADEIFPENALPRRYLGFSSCFRREAGSYGKDTKGILRVHQFDKVEMFSFARAEDSPAEHRFLLACEEYLMRKLKIPYRVLELATGDLGTASAATFDIESWLPGQNGGKGEYRETHSTSNTTDFQARRLGIKYRKQDRSLEFAHMLNGTAFAIGRMVIALLENYQTTDGAFTVPEALKPYV